MQRARGVWLVLAAAGCGFNPAGGEVTGDDDGGVEIDAAEDDASETDATEIDAAMIDAPDIDAAMIDARVDAAVDAAVDAPVVTPLCNAGNPALRACFTFTGGTVTNGAGTTLTITTQNIGTTAGPVGDALAVGATSHVHIAETPALDLVGPYTFEAFVRLGATPPNGGRAGIYDENGEFGIFVDDQRRVYCTNGPVIGPALVLGTWTHIACVYDRSNVILYVNGQVNAMTALTGDLNTATADGGNLGQDCRGNGAPGDPLTGALDEVRIWATARTAGEIAAAAARSMP